MTNTKKKLSELLEKCEKSYATYLSNKDYKMRNAKTEVEFQQEIDSIEKRYDFYADELLKNGVILLSEVNGEKTNRFSWFDKIKSMGINEMAEFFAIDKQNNFPSSACYICDYDEGIFCGNDNCTDEYKVRVYKEWLEREFMVEPENECMIDLSAKNKEV